MNELLIGLLGSLLATNPVQAASNVVLRTTGIRLPMTDPNDPVEKELQRLLSEDDAAQAEVDRWIKDNQAFGQQGAGLPQASLNARIDQRFEAVIKGYEEFLRQHREHARARLAYGSFLNDTGREEEALAQWERARELEPKNPAAWNNLANIYSHRGPVRKAFECLDQAIQLNPAEAVYHQNLATLVFLFRRDAQDHYHLADDQEVLRRALELYRQARKRDPEDFALATDLAQTYYFLKPPATADAQAARTAQDKLIDEAVTAWREAQKLAHDDLEREGIYVHLARVCLTNGRLTAAREHLAAITNANYAVLKARLTRNLDEKERAARSEPAPATGSKPAAN